MSGKPTGRRLEMDGELYKILSDRLQEKWDSVRHFSISNARTMGLSAETVRRAFVPDPNKGLESYTLANIMLHLDYSREEIVELLRTYTNDELMVRLMEGTKDETIDMTPQEQTFLTASRQLQEKEPNLYVMLAQTMKPLAAAYKLNIPQLSDLERTTGKKRR